MNWWQKEKAKDLFEQVSKMSPGAKPDPQEVERLLGYVPTEQEDPGLSDWANKRMFNKELGWAVPTQKAIQEIVDFVGNDTVLEIGSGYGLWAALMQEAGINVVATDDISGADELYGGSSGLYHPVNKSFTEIEDLKHTEAIKRYSQHIVLMLGWPPYDSSMGVESLSAFAGNKLIYIGEGKRGCTACDKFFDLLNKDWQFIKTVYIPKFRDIHDTMKFYVRKT